MPGKTKKKLRMLSENLFPVVGVGASAGGLEAFKALVQAIPESSGIAYIFIQHLAPQHESMLADILQKLTTVPVVQIIDHTKIVPDHIYIIPSNKILTASDGILLLDPLIKEDKTNTIDIFFNSLAEIHLSNAIGIVLSGRGTDGTVGLKTIKDQGGITIAQDKSAAHCSMPQSAIDAEVVDYVLSPEEIPRYLEELIHNSRIVISGLTITEESKEEDVFKQILTLLRVKRGTDFTYYKQTTIRRRIIRRKALNRIDYLKDYYQFLFENRAEQDALFKDLLIPVTAFFRDSRTFETIKDTLFPVLFKDKAAWDPVRVWVAGCSTGEEAYSMAVLLDEYFGDKTPYRKIQVFATDISETVIAKARKGIYDKKDTAGVSIERLKQYFTKTDGSYQVNKAIREMCVFATQNFLKDPPFAKLDLVSCRNVLIYMDSYLQKKAITTFHYALNPLGCLILGKSETTGRSAELFRTFSQFEKIYTKKAFTGRYRHIVSESSEMGWKGPNTGLQHAGARKEDFQKSADEAILSRYAMVGVIVNEQLNVLHFRGSTGAYLEAPSGEASLYVLKMAREGLSFELRNALHKAKLGNEAIRKEGIVIDKGKRRVNIEVIPLPDMIELYFLILFSDANPVSAGGNELKNSGTHKEEQQDLIRIEELENELAQLHEDMRAIAENQDAVNEELQSANEDLLTSTEEMQSLNEELETTNEEIQSSNEELTILNQELLDRNEQLVNARKYTEAIVATIHEPLIVLTKDFYVRSANKAFYEKFQVTEQQIKGRTFFEMGKENWNVPDLRERLNRILPAHDSFEGYEITLLLPDQGELIMMLNARQILNDDNSEQLILLAMQDITERKVLERQVLEQTRELKEANTNLRYSNDNLEQFASIASHDLQEPLRKIKTFTAILTRNFTEVMPQQGKEVIEKIRLSANRMSQLVKEVLEYSKLTHAADQYSPTDLNLIVTGVIDDLDLLVAETGAMIDYKEALPVIEAIPLQMNQLFYNLLTNALKFRKKTTPPTIAISFRYLTTEEIAKNQDLNQSLSYVELVVSDDGIGFEQQFADQIFQLFERLHSIDEYEGTGVGLALSKKIVENHNGDIYAISEENNGASFYIFLPVKQS